jgi:hypothetical protein
MNNGRTWILLYHYAAGLSDTLTGLLLLFAPAWTLHLMGVSQVPQPLFFASYVGVFVLCVGATYLWVPASRLTSLPRSACWRTQWLITALFRSLIAIFVFAEIAVGTMERGWIAVALTDGVFAAIQWMGLRRNWLALTD